MTETEQTVSETVRLLGTAADEERPLSYYLAFTVVGTPAPQGSKRSLQHRHSNKIVTVESGHEKVQTWRQDVITAAQRATDAPFDGPVEIVIHFRFRRLKSHYRTGRNAHLVRADAPEYVVTKPDIDKLLRSTLDALTLAGIWADDKQAVKIAASKHYCDGGMRPGARIVITAIGTGGTVAG